MKKIWLPLADAELNLLFILLVLTMIVSGAWVENKRYRRLIMILEKIKLDNFNAISSDTNNEGIRIRQSGMAKVLWQELDMDVPESTIISNGVDLYKD